MWTSNHYNENKRGEMNNASRVHLELVLLSTPFNYIHIVNQYCIILQTPKGTNSETIEVLHGGHFAWQEQ